MYVQQFQFNLLSVGKLLSDQQVSIQFKPDYYCFHDLATPAIIAVAWKNEGLYKLNNYSFDECVIKKLSVCLSTLEVENKGCVWHQRLGHASGETLSHIPNIDSKCNSGYVVCHSAK